MKTRVLHLFTRTPLHVGAGSAVGAVDMPIQRERHTQIPIIPGSALKGVLRDVWNGHADQVALFGSESRADELTAGQLVVGEARVLCFPVRSAKGGFAWITSPLALQRYARDTGRNLPELSITDDIALAGAEVQSKEGVVLEEYVFKTAGLPDGVVELLKGAINDPLWATLPKRLVVVSDGIFSHFCATACEVQQRIRIDDDKGTVAEHALFNQENVPAETLFHAVLADRREGALAKLAERLPPVLQIGGDATIGLGFCSVSLGGAS